MRWPLRRRAKPSPAEPGGPELRLERERYLPGETVRGSVVVPASGGAAAVEVSLNFRERSTEYETITVAVPGERLAEGDRAPGRVHRFAIDLPPDALPSQSSMHGELWWTVDARIGGPDSPAVLNRRVEIRSAAPTGPGSRGAEGRVADRPPRS